MAVISVVQNGAVSAVGFVVQTGTESAAAAVSSFATESVPAATALEPDAAGVHETAAAAAAPASPDEPDAGETPAASLENAVSAGSEGAVSDSAAEASGPAVSIGVFKPDSAAVSESRTADSAADSEAVSETDSAADSESTVSEPAVSTDSSEPDSSAVSAAVSESETNRALIHQKLEAVIYTDETYRHRLSDRIEEQAAKGSAPSAAADGTAGAEPGAAPTFESDGLTPSDAQTDVVITLEGRMPAGAVVRAYPVQVRLPGENPVLSYDISILDPAGRVFQPAGNTIQVTVTGAVLKNLRTANIYHMADEQAEPERIAGAVPATGDCIAFDAAAFSIYIIAADQPVYYRTYYFHDENGHVIDRITEKLAAGEALKRPQAPVREHAVFDGWYTTPDYHQEFLTWGTVGELYQDETVHLYAKFRDVYHVYYNAEDRMSDPDDPVMVFFTQTYEVGRNQLLDFTDVPFAVQDGEALVGWSLQPGGVDPVENLSTYVTADLSLFPIVKKARWITFESEGGSYVKPAYVLENDRPTEPEPPTRPGYAFAGWYREPSLRNRYFFNQTVAENLTLYAGWTPVPTDYRVMFWQQSVYDDKNAADADKTYVYAGSETRTGYPGETASVRYEDQHKQYPGFHYNSARQTSIQIQADGSAVLNVYYDRDLMSIYFYQNGSRRYTYTGLYGSKLSDQNLVWPALPSGYKWRNQTDGLFETFLDTFLFAPGSYNASNNVKTVTATYVGTSDVYVEHYIERLGGGYEPAPRNRNELSGISFTTSEKYVGFSIAEKQHRFKREYYDRYGWRDYGATYWGTRSATAAGVVLPAGPHSTQVGSNGYLAGGYPYRDVYRDLRLYYTRNRYQFKYVYGINGAELPDLTETLEFEAPITPALDKAEPPRPRDQSGVELIPDYYVFKGWYQDPEGQVPYRFDSGQKMQAHHEIVYAVWKPLDVTVSFDPGNGGSVPSQTFTAGQKASRPEPPERDGYVFAGWVTAKGSPFNFAAEVLESVHLVARWISSIGYRTHYFSNYPAGSVPPGTPEDTHDGPKLYVPGAQAKTVPIESDWNWQTPDGKVGFLYWNTRRDGTGEIYYPGERIVLTSNAVNLYAIWSEPLAAHITYDLNYDSEAPSPGDDVHKLYYEDNATDAVIGERGIRSLVEARVGYRFVGWSTQKQWDGVSRLWQNGTVVGVNTVNDAVENTLYAQWLRVVDISVMKTLSGNMSDDSRKFRFNWTLKKGDLERSGSFELSVADGLVTPDMFRDLSEGTTVTITEADYSGEGYRNFDITDQPTESGYEGQTMMTPQSRNLAARTWTYTLDRHSFSNSIRFSAVKTAVAPTGLKTDRAAPLAAVLLAGIGAVVLLLLKRRDRLLRDG